MTRHCLSGTLISELKSASFLCAVVIHGVAVAAALVPEPLFGEPATLAVPTAGGRIAPPSLLKAGLTALGDDPHMTLSDCRVASQSQTERKGKRETVRTLDKLRFRQHVCQTATKLVCQQLQFIFDPRIISHHTTELERHQFAIFTTTLDSRKKLEK